jgi:hypothetical protein
MQNKPNLPDAQMNVTAVNTMNNELRTMNYFLQNKPNQTQSQTLHTLAHFYPSFLTYFTQTLQPNRASPIFRPIRRLSVAAAQNPAGNGI